MRSRVSHGKHTKLAVCLQSFIFAPFVSYLYRPSSSFYLHHTLQSHVIYKIIISTFAWPALSMLLISALCTKAPPTTHISRLQVSVQLDIQPVYVLERKLVVHSLEIGQTSIYKTIHRNDEFYFFLLFIKRHLFFIWLYLTLFLSDFIWSYRSLRQDCLWLLSRGDRSDISARICLWLFLPEFLWSVADRYCPLYRGK